MKGVGAALRGTLLKKKRGCSVLGTRGRWNPTGLPNDGPVIVRRGGQKGKGGGVLNAREEKLSPSYGSNHVLGYRGAQYKKDACDYKVQQGWVSGMQDVKGEVN